MAAGEVILNGAVIGSTGSYQSNGNVIANLFDANEMTVWDAANASGDWAGVDAGAATLLTRVRITAKAGFQYRFNGAVIQGDVADATFATGAVTLLTGGSSALKYGLLQNEYLLSPGTSYRYYRLVSAANGYGGFADLDFIGNYVAGVNAQCCTPTISPPGGQYDAPIRVRINCITTDAVFYYTLDGSTPTTSSAQYSGPITISSSGTLKVIGVSPNVVNSRVASATFYVPHAITPNNQVNDDRNLQLFAADGCLFQDPISKWWYLYGQDYDGQTLTSNNYNNGYKGVNIYKSPDLRNWTFVAQVDNPTSDGATTKFAERWHILYNTANNNYVVWRKQAATGSKLEVLTSSSPTGPFTSFATYTTLDGVNGTNGDIYLFIDPADGVTAYLVRIGDTSDHTWFVDKLTPDYKNVSGAFTQVTMATAWGANYEGPAMFKRGSQYFMVMSRQTVWAPNENDYFTASSPLGPWTKIGNPFQPVTGGTPDYTTAYDTQTFQVLQIPGRDDGSGQGAWVYLGDRYDVPSGTGNFQAWRLVMVPISFPSPSQMVISWPAGGAWNLDSIFPTIGGAPLPPTGLAITGSTLTWVNHETNPHALYVDFASDPFFTSNVSSEVVTQGTTSISTWGTGFYRVRAVNASGTSSNISVYNNPPTASSPQGPISGVLTTDTLNTQFRINL